MLPLEYYSILGDYFKHLIDFYKNDSEINLNSLARSLNISESSLYREVKLYSNISPIQLYNVLRFYEAKEMVMFNYPIDDILYRIKIDSLSYFHKRFKNYFLFSPQVFRRKYLTKNSAHKKFFKKISNRSLSKQDIIDFRKYLAIDRQRGVRLPRSGARQLSGTQEWPDCR